MRFNSLQFVYRLYLAFDKPDCVLEQLHVNILLPLKESHFSLNASLDADFRFGQLWQRYILIDESTEPDQI